MDVNGRIIAKDAALFLNDENRAQESYGIMHEILRGLMIVDRSGKEAEALAQSKGFSAPSESRVQGMGRAPRARKRCGRANSRANSRAMVPFSPRGGASLAVMPSETLQSANSQSPNVEGQGPAFRFNMNNRSGRQWYSRR